MKIMFNIFKETKTTIHHTQHMIYHINMVANMIIQDDKHVSNFDDMLMPASLT